VAACLGVLELPDEAGLQQYCVAGDIGAAVHRGGWHAGGLQPGGEFVLAELLGPAGDDCVQLVTVAGPAGQG
jgi:hypothetical protein